MWPWLVSVTTCLVPFDWRHFSIVITKFGMSFALPGTEDDFVTGQLDPLASDGNVTEGSRLQQEIEIR